MNLDSLEARFFFFLYLVSFFFQVIGSYKLILLELIYTCRYINLTKLTNLTCIKNNENFTYASPYV